MTEEETREAVIDALDSLPSEIADRLDNVRELHPSAEEVKRTVLHEIGHYFGMDERRVRGWGL
jgi:predicted Zn-dependent protease with MMP-like domain